MRNLYFVLEETVAIDGELYPTYSIVNPMAGVCHDVTCDRNKAYKIAKRFNNANLSPVHMFDAIEDSII